MLNITLTRSHQLAISLLIMHGVAAACWVYLPLAWWAKIGGGVVVGASAAWSIARHAWLATPRSVVGLRCEADGLALITSRNGTSSEVRVAGDSFVTPYLTVVLCIFPTGRRARAIIMADALPTEQFRQLRVWLKWRAGEGTKKSADGGWAARV